MVLIPLEAYKNLRRNILQSTDNSTMQKELIDIKEQYGESIPADQRLRLESDVIAKHTGIKQVPEHVPEVIPKSNTDILKNNIENFSKTNKNRAVQLFNHLTLFYKDKPQWNEKGELYVNSQVLPRTNITDMISYVTSTKSKRAPPNGFSHFLELLDEANVASHLFSAHGLRNIEEHKQDTGIKSTVDGGHDVWIKVSPNNKRNKKKK